ncbi:MAG: glycosyltransferase family 4 protein [Gammaproteobacteria bacterium]|nr:glycosyltransferase family 4 protein [Gammaproteobacteria bacterium]
MAVNKEIRPVAVMCFSSGTGGMERSAVRLAEALSKISEVTLLCKKGSFTQKHYDEGDYPFACETVSYMSRTFSPSMMFQVRAIIDKRDIKNVIFFGASELKTLYFSYLGKDLNVTVWHGTTKSRPKRDAFHRLVYSCVDQHVAISKHLERNVKQIVPITEPEKYRVIRPSFNFDENDKPVDNKDSECLNIVHVGRVAQGKGQVDAVKACQGLHEAGIRFSLSLVGGSEGDDYMNELIQAVESSAYRSSINMEGYVEDVNAYLKKADVFLFPSSGEGMPGSYIEALHFGLICVSYDNTVFPEFLEMGFHVHIVKNKSVDALAKKLCDIAASLEVEKEKSSSNIELAKHSFSEVHEISEWLEVLE